MIEFETESSSSEGEEIYDATATRRIATNDIGPGTATYRRFGSFMGRKVLEFTIF